MRDSFIEKMVFQLGCEGLIGFQHLKLKEKDAQNREENKVKAQTLESIPDEKQQEVLLDYSNCSSKVDRHEKCQQLLVFLHSYFVELWHLRTHK